MGMREKLIELLDDIQACGEDFTDYEIYGMRLPNTVSNEEVADHLIANGVTIPVRCEDCKHFGGHGTCYCHAADENGTPIFVREDDFCSYGERRTDD